MAERIQSVTAVDSAPSGVQDLVPFEPPSTKQAEAVRQAIANVETAIVADQPKAAREINTLLEALEPSQPNGRLLLELIESPTFGVLADDLGRRCRAEAVRALLRLGFPWALEIEPETLAWFRSVDARRSRVAARTLFSIALAGALLGGFLGYFQPELSAFIREPPAPTAAQWPRPSNN